MSPVKNAIHHAKLSRTTGTASSLLVIIIMFLCTTHVAAFKFSRLCARASPRDIFTRMLAVKGEKVQRLERIISNRGVGSRNDVAKLFRQGRVSINGDVIRSGADKYPLDVVVEIDGESIEGVPLLAVYHKPVGIHSTLGDPWGRATLDELYLEYPYMKTMHPVGRLDADTSGLLLFSSDGHLTQLLLHPTTGIEREYEAVVAEPVDASVLGPKLAAGIKTTEGTFAADLLFAKNLDEKAMVPVVAIDDDYFEDEDSTSALNRKSSSAPGDDDTKKFVAAAGGLHVKGKIRSEIAEKEKAQAREKAAAAKAKTATKISLSKLSGEKLLQKSGGTGGKDTTDGIVLGKTDKQQKVPMKEVSTAVVRVSVKEGKYRMVRRVLHNAGHSVLKLHRVRYGKMLLGEELDEGEVRPCTQEEKQWAQMVIRNATAAKNQALRMAAAASFSAINNSTSSSSPAVPAAKN